MSKNKFILIKIFMILMLFGLFHSSGLASARKADVLLLHSYHTPFEWTRRVYDGVAEEMSSMPFRVTIHNEFMDTKYFHGKKYYDSLENLYKTKYEQNRPDVIISSDNNALNFLLKRRDSLFSDVPIVFLGVNAFNRSMLRGDRKVTGVVEEISITGTIESALRLYPNVDRIVAYASDLPTAVHNSRIFLEKKKRFENRARLELKTGLSINDVLEDIKKLPSSSAVLLLSFVKDDNKVILPMEKTAELMSHNSSIPVFGFWDFLLGHGIVGGQLVSGAYQGKTAGRMACRILMGESVDTIPIVYKSPNKYMFDENVLRRLGYNSAGLPPETILVNKKISFYSQYKAVVWFASALFIIMGGAILLLWRSRIVRRRIEVQLRHSKETYDLVTRGTNDGIWDLDKESGKVFFSERWKEILGYTDNEISNDIKEWLVRIHPDDYDRVLEANKEFDVNGGDRFQVEYRMIAKDGSIRWIMGRGSCLRDENGEPYRIAGAHTDITERKKYVEELRRLRNYLENIINSMPSILIGVDFEGVVTQWNSKAVELSGISSDEAAGLNLKEAFPGIADDYDRIMGTIIENKILVDPPRILSTRDGSTRYRELTVFPLDYDGRMGAVIRIDDVTQRVRLEQMMVQTEKMMSLGGMAAGMAHEINNPLAGILGNLHNLRRRLYSDLRLNKEAASEADLSLSRMRNYLDKREIPGLLDGIANSAGKAATVVRNMISFSRGSERLFEYNNIEQLLEETLELAMTDYDLKRRYDFKKIKIVRKYATGLPAVYCDGAEIRQVFLNLIKNAAEATAKKEYQKGGPQITLCTDTDSEMIVISIEDNGPGITESERRRVFEPFYTSKMVGEGTGLGLSVSYFIITDQHKGIMQVESCDGEWTRFTIRLPAG